MSPKLTSYLTIVVAVFTAFIFANVYALYITQLSIQKPNSDYYRQPKVAGEETTKPLFNSSALEQSFKNIIGNNATYDVDYGNNTLTHLSWDYSSNKMEPQAIGDIDQLANNFNQQYAVYMGITNPSTDLELIKKTTDSLGMTRFVYQQKYNGLPVFGAQTSLHFDNQNRVKTFTGKTIPNINLTTTATISKSTAQNQAILAFESLFGFIEDKNGLTAESELGYFNAGLINNNSDNSVYLAWKVRIIKEKSIDDSFYINATSGNSLKHIPHILSINRRIADCSYGDGECYYYYDSGTYIYGRVEGQPQRGIPPGEVYPDTDSAYDFTGATHNYYLNKLGRSGANTLGGLGNGTVDSPSADTIAITHFEEVDDPLDPMCPNAFFSPENSMIFFCQGLVDLDILAHEYQHAVTHFSVPDSLTYSYQSGALNESFSDIFGTAVEFESLGTNDIADGTTAWLIGEGVDPADMGGRDGTRSLSTPGDFEYGTGLPYPDRFYSPTLYCGEQDNGGVHLNATVFSHAAYLMATGGDFNGCSISGIGRDKMERILYRALTVYTTSTSNFNNMYNHVNSACTDLIGTNGLTSDDCEQVTAALQATEMDQLGRCSSTARVTPICAQEEPPIDPPSTISVALEVNLQFATDNSTAIQVVFVEDGSGDTSKSSGTTNSNGSATINTTLTDEGDYDIYFKPQYYLSQFGTWSIETGENDLAINKDFVGGDLNNDDVINAIDYSLFVGNYGLTGMGDLNKDGVINAIDYAILYQNYGQSGEFFSNFGISWTW